MKQFYLTSILLLLFFTMPMSYATMASKPNAAPSTTNLLLQALAPGDLSATISGATSFCAGSAGGTIVFEGAGGTAPYTFTYQVDGGTVQTITSTGLSNSVNVPVNTSTAKDITYRIISVKGATGKTTLVDVIQRITVLKAPVVDFSISGAACSGTPVQFNSAVQGEGGYTYLWDFGDGLTSTEQNPTHEFSSLGCGWASFTVSLTVTDSNGCSATRIMSISVQQKPDISFIDLNFPFGDPFNNCGYASANSPDYTISVGNTSLSSGCINSYSINWGDGSAPVANATFPSTHTYKTLGSFEMVITAYGANGCTNEITYVVKNTNNPSVGITSPGTTTNLCAPTAPLMFEIAKWGTNTPGTIYTVDYGDGSPILTFTQEQLMASPYYVASNPSASANFPIPHSYTLPNCPNGPYMVRLTATNACSSTEATVNNITVFNKTTPDFTAPAHACVNSSVVFTNTSIPGYNPSCNQTSIYTWDFGDGTPQEVTSPTLPKNTSHTYTAPGQYTVRLITKNICGESSTTRVITIDPPLTATATATGIVSGTVTFCQGAPMQEITFTGSNGTAPYTFTYRINNGPLQTVTTAPGSSSVTVQVPTGTTGSFTYTLVSISDASPTACTQVQTGAVTVVVAAPPSGSISGNETACLNDASPVVTFTGSGGTRPYTFTYNINGGPTLTISTSGSSNSVTITVPTTAAGVFKYNLIGVQDSGAGTCSRAVSESATVTISLPPAPMTLPNYEYCNGETTTAITFTNTVAGTTYRWTNSNTAIGLGASGNGNIPSFTARNTTGAPIIATITVTPSVYGCEGASQTFTITVYPSAVQFSRGAQILCSGETTSEVTLTSPSGAALSWTAIAPAGITGVIASGTNTIPVQTLVNTTNTPITVIYTAQAALPVSDPCSGTQYTYSITVNPRPVVLQTFNLEICSGSAFTVSPQNNADNSIPSGTRYTWSAPVISPEGAITGASAQAAPQTSISQTLVNTTSAAATATYTVTPIANGCAGNTFTIVVTVLPLPTATVSGSATVCQNAEMPVITFTGSNGTAPYTFSYRINNGAVRTITSTSGNSATVDASTDIAGTFTYTLVSVQDIGITGCIQNQSGSAIITVQPIPTASISGDATVCKNSPSPVITFTGSGGTRPYTFTYNINGGASQTISTSATSNTVTVAVPTTAVGTFKYNLTEVQSSGVDGCSRTLSTSATVTVTELPAAMTLPNHAFCNGEMTSAITFTNAVAGTTYSWTNSNTSIGLSASGTDPIASFTAINTTSSPVTSTITVIPSVNGCNGASQSFTITVQPSPVVTFSTGAQIICSGENTLAVTLGSNTAGAEFSWTADQPAGITGVITSGTATIPSQTLVNTTNAPVTVTYRAKATTTGAVPCSGNEVTYSITVNPTAEVKESFAVSICSGSAFTVSPEINTDNRIPSGARYTWSAPVISPAGAITGASAQADPQSIISQTLVNTTSAVATATYTVTLVTNGCAGISFTIVVTVLPLPTATVSGSVTVCQNAEMPVITFTGSNGTAPYTFTYRINNGAVTTITSTSGNSATVEASTDIAGTFTYTLVSLQDKGITGCIQNQSGSAIITVQPIPTASISGDASVCKNSPSPVITLTGSGGTRPYTFTYNINGGGAETISTDATSNSVTLAVPTTAAGVYTYNLTGVQGAGAGACSSTVISSATVIVKELPAAMTLPNFTFCNGETTSEITFTNAVAGTTYSWSNSNPSIGLSASGTDPIASFTAINATSSPVTSTITVIPSVNGCNGANQSFTITVQPSPIVTFSAANQTMCSGESTSAVTLTSNTAGAEFSWTADQPAGITGVITSGTNTIPVQTLVNTTNAPVTVTYMAKATTSGAVTCSGSEATYTITVNPRAVVNEAFEVNICSGSAFSVSPENNADNSIPSGTRYTWSAPVISPAGAITGASAQAAPQSTISQTLVNTTSAVATATYTVTPVVNGCAGNSFTIVVTVFSLPTATVSGDATVCQNSERPLVTFTGNNGTAPYTFSYRINNGAVQTVSTDLVSNSVTVEVPTDQTGSYTYTLMNVTEETPSACTHNQSGSVTVVVNVPPSAFVSGDATVCSNSPSPVITFTGSGGTRPYTFTYNINGGGAETISTDATSNSVTLAVPTTAAGVYTYNLTGVQGAGAGACSSTVISSATVTVTESPAAMTLPNFTLCNGETTSAITFTNAVAGTTYRWTNSNTSIGLSASGTGPIASFTALNATSSPITSTITVIPSVNGCNGASQSFTITVQPSPVVTFSTGAQTVCSGENTLPVTLGSSTPGVQYSWEADQPAGITGMTTSGSNAIPSQMLVNTTSAPITVTYRAKATTSEAVTCSGNEATYSITVNPKAGVKEAFAVNICSGSVFNVSPENNADNWIPSGTRYTWSAPVVSPAGAITGASAQAIPQSTISQALVNTTSAAATATYTVTPVVNGCAGESFTIVVTVLPVSTISTVSDITLCNGEQAAEILLSGNVSGAVYQWTNDNPSIGFEGNGTDRIGPFTAVNTGNSPVQSRISVTPIFTNGNLTCEGTSVQFTITVNPEPQVNPVEDLKVCSGNSLSVDFTTPNTGGVTTYEWTNSNPAIGLSASGSGLISFVPVNKGNTILSATITVTPVFTNKGVSCKGAPEVFTISVEPTATVLKPLDQEVCNGYPTDEIRFTGNLSNTVYQWTTDNTTIGLPISGSGDIMSFTAVNNGTEPVVATINVTPVTNGCNGTAESFTITVNPTPVVLTQPQGSAVCLGERPATLTVAVRGVGSPSYQWYSNTTASTSGGVLISNSTGASYDPPADVTGTFYYYCVITYPNNDCTLLTSAVAEVTIHPVPVISAVDQEISSGEVFTVIPAWGNGNIVPPGTAYIWSDPVVSPAGSVSGAMAQTVPQAEISQRLFNTTTQSATVTYTVFPVSNSCTGSSFKVTVYVDSPISPNVSVTPIACFGMNNGSITTSIQGGAPFAGDTPYIILWTGPNGFTSKEASIFNLIPGVYHLVITDSRGKQFTADYTITAPEEMIMTDEKRDVSCYGAADGRISITINGGTAPYQTIWTKDNAPFATTEDISGLSPGTYAVTVTDAKGCVPINRSWMISQPEPLAITLKGKSDIRCFGDSTGYVAVDITGGVMIETASGVYGYRYLWSGPDGFTSVDKNLSKLPVGDYTLQVTDGAGCTQSLFVSLNGPSPLAVVTETTPISCYGANNATIRLDITGGTPPYEADWNNYATGTFQDNLSPGSYTILITDAAQCQVSTTVNIPEAPVFKVNPEVKNVSCYGAKNGSISLNFETTLKSIIFRWSDNSRSGTTRNNIGPGTYTVYIQGGDLCMINRTFIVTEPLPMEISGKVTDITDCSIVDGGAIDLMVTGGTPPYRYAWSNGAVTEDLKNLQAGNYAITVSDSMGCSQVAQYTVKRPLPLEIDVKTSIDHDCATSDVKAISTAKVSGGVTPYQLKWSTGTVSGPNNEQMETRQSGIIVLTVTDQTGCTAIQSFDLDVPDPGITSHLVDCNAHIFQFTGTSAVESQAITYTWDFGDGTTSNLRNPQHAYSAAGNYKVRLTVAGDGPCVSEYEDVVHAATPPVVGIDKDPRFCPGDSILIYGTGADTYRWNDGTTGDSIWIKREGDFSVTGTSASGCFDTYDFKASYYDLIGYTIQSDQQEVSALANRIRLWSENIPYSNYRWDFGDGYSGDGAEVFHSYEITDDGYFDVTLTVINPNGCKEVTTKRIWKSVAAIANTFTPNSDGINDIYLKGWQIEVFNRNGILMYKGDQGWDGKHDGRLVDNDTYFVIIYDSTQMGAEYKKSYVTVLR